MFQAPKSLTATVHVRFHYQEPESGAVDAGEIEMVSKILDQASELSPELRELLVKFANYLNELSHKTDEQSRD